MNERRHEDLMAIVRPIWSLLSEVWGITSEQVGWWVLYALLDHKLALTAEQITPELIAEGLLLIGSQDAGWVGAMLASWRQSYASE